MTRCCMRAFVLTLVSLSPLVVSSSLARAQSADENKKPLLVNLKFPGGTITEYLAALRHKIGDEVNVVVADERAGRPRLPAMELAQVDMEAAVYLVRGAYTLEDGSKVEVYVENIEARSAKHGRPLYRVASIDKGRKGAPQVKVWSLSDLIGDRIKAEDALTAVELAVGLADSSEGAADVRFHEATSLLVAHGSHDQIQAIDSVIDQLMEGEEQIRQKQEIVQGVEDFVGWIEEMRQFDEAQQAQARQNAAQQNAGDAPPQSDLRGSYQTGTANDGSLLHEFQRLSRVVEDQARKIRSLEQRLAESKKQ